MNEFNLLFKISRPLGWLVGPLIFLAAFFYSGSELSFLAILQIVFLSFPYSILVYGINDIYDSQSDKLNGRKGREWGIKLSKKYHKFVKQVCVYIAIALFLSSLITFNLFNILSMLGLLFFTYAYSAQPFRFKSRAPLDSVSNGLIFLLIVYLGYSFLGNIYEIDYKVYLIVLAVIGIHAYSTIMDYSIDKKIKDKTFSVVFGKRTTSLFSLVLFLLIIFFSDIQSKEIIYYLSYCSLFFFISIINSSERLTRTFIKLIFLGFLVSALLFIF